MLEPGPYVIVDTWTCRRLRNKGRRKGALRLGRSITVTGRCEECSCCVMYPASTYADGRPTPKGVLRIRPENLRPLRDPDVEEVEEREGVVV